MISHTQSAQPELSILHKNISSVFGKCVFFSKREIPQITEFSFLIIPNYKNCSTHRLHLLSNIWIGSLGSVDDKQLSGFKTLRTETLSVSVKFPFYEQTKHVWRFDSFLLLTSFFLFLFLSLCHMQPDEE